jgi:type VI secretion system protein VasD
MTTSSLSRLTIIAFLTCATLALAACGSAPKKHGLEILITASADVNPDLESRASPVILHVLELTAIDEFNRADYFSLTQDDAAALGVDVVNKTELILTPGSQKSLTLELDEKVTYLGLVAGYRDIDNSRWRIAEEIRPGKTERVSVSLGRDQVSIVEIKD